MFTCHVCGNRSNRLDPSFDPRAGYWKAPVGWQCGQSRIFQAAAAARAKAVLAIPPAPEAPERARLPAAAEVLGDGDRGSARRAEGGRVARRKQAPPGRREGGMHLRPHLPPRDLTGREDCARRPWGR